MQISDHLDIRGMTMLRKKCFHSIILLQLLLLLFTAGCSENDTYYKLNGYWEGENKNIDTGIDWPFSLYIEHRGTDISGIARQGLILSAYPVSSRSSFSSVAIC